MPQQKPQTSRWWPRLASPFKAPEWGLVAGILAVLAVIYLLDRDHAFYSELQPATLLAPVALFGVLAVGAAVVIIAGGIDLSTGAVVALASVVSAKLLTEWLRDVSSVAAAIDRADRRWRSVSRSHGTCDRRWSMP